MFELVISGAAPIDVIRDLDAMDCVQVIKDSHERSPETSAYSPNPLWMAWAAIKYEVELDLIREQLNHDSADEMA